MNKKFLIGVVFASFLLTACGQSTKVAPSGGHTVGDSVFFSAPGDGHQYVLTDEKISTVGKGIFDFHGPGATSLGGGWATNDSDAMGVYQIPGIDTTKTVAVRLKNGTYVKATVVVQQWVESYGNTQPPHYYVLTKTAVSNVGALISRVNLLTHGPGGWTASTDQIVGVYDIPGVQTDVAVAVKLKDGSYVKAVSYGTQKP